MTLIKNISKGHLYPSIHVKLRITPNHFSALSHNYTEVIDELDLFHWRYLERKKLGIPNRGSDHSFSAKIIKEVEILRATVGSYAD